MPRGRLCTFLFVLTALGPIGALRAQLLRDGGFEAGPAGGSWTEFSQNFGTPICSVATCGNSAGTGPATGSYWAWFGGSQTAEEAFVEQTFNLSQGNVQVIRFALEHPTASGNGEDFLRVLVDGEEVFRFNEGDPGHPAYHPVILDLSSYNDGASHTLRFHSKITGTGGISSFFVDQVAAVPLIVTEPPAPFLFDDGFETGNTQRWSLTEPSCTFPGAPDADGDRLVDCVETNTGVFHGPLATGTDPNKADTDGDGLQDGDEVLGTEGGLDLLALGVSPVRADILIEYDWFNDHEECAFHSHRPTPAALNRITTAFANAPVTNPDGSTGINVIHDYGQGGVFLGGNLVMATSEESVLEGGLFSAEYFFFRENNFTPNRRGYFRYGLLPHQIYGGTTQGGEAEHQGDAFIASLFCNHSDNNLAHVVMHELGHNLGLDHGGFEACNYKPNYNSIMNYGYTYVGVDGNCVPGGDGRLDFSVGEYPTLDENHLDEFLGLCDFVSFDWNGNGFFESDATANINAYPLELLVCGSLLSVLADHDDWGNLFFAGLEATPPLTGTTRIITDDFVVPPGTPARLLTRQTGVPSSP